MIMTRLRYWNASYLMLLNHVTKLDFPIVLGKTMKINEVVLNEGWGDAFDRVRSAIYKNTGFGGDPANIAGSRIKFLDDFKQELALAQRSAKNAGVELKNEQFAKRCEEEGKEEGEALVALKATLRLK